MGGIVNIVVGAILIGGGLSGYITTRGQDNGWLFALIGVVIGGWGVYRLIQARAKGGK